MSLINQVLLDLEKRHASESELNSLPPFVRAVPARPQSYAKPIGIAAGVAVALAALVAAYLYPRHPAGEENARTVSKPVATPVPAPEPIAPPKPQPVAAAPDAPRGPEAPTFSPVSRLSDELALVAPTPRKEKPAVISRVDKPVPTVLPDLPKEAPPAEKPEKPQKPADPPKAELPSKPSATPEPAPLAANESPAAIDKQMRDASPAERAEMAFRKGAAQIQEGRANAAELEFREALKLDPSHAAARQALLGLLLDAGRNAEAEQLLHKALEINPRQPRHAMVLARLEVERGEVAGAINTMVAALPYVQSDPEFYAFLAALLQREGRNRESADYYRAALRGVPGNGVWMMGLGISLRGANQAAEARDAFERALESKQLSPDLQEFVEKQLRELSAKKR